MQSGHIIFGQCIYCEHYQGYVESAGALACTAFPKGIPEAITDGTFDHRESFDGEKTLFKVAEGMGDGFMHWLMVREALLDSAPVEIKPRVRQRPVYRSKE